MEGASIHWFTLLRENEAHLTWEKFKQALLLRYGGTIYDNPFEELSVLHQSSAMEDYIEYFEFIYAQVPRLTEAQ